MKTALIEMHNQNKDNLKNDLLLAIVKEIVIGDNDHILTLLKNSSLNLVKFKNDLAYHGLAPLAYVVLRRYFSLLPKELVIVLEATYGHYLIYIARAQKVFLDLHEIFKKENITMIPIKGIALLEDIYIKYPVRSICDIDVLVREEDVEKAFILLEKAGFKKDLEGLKEDYWRKKQYHIVFVKEFNNFKIIVELHWQLDYPRKGVQLLSNMFDRLRETPMLGNKISLLSVEDTFFVSALHQRRLGIALSLKDVCDMALLLNKYKSSFDWDYILSESKKSRLCSTVYFALYQVNFLLKVDVPDYILKKLNVSMWRKRVIQRFIKKNTLSEIQNNQTKNLYLKMHFLLYDDIWEPVEYILNIPQEQFAKFYNLEPYSKKTQILYQFRLLYIIFKTINGALKSPPLPNE